MNTDMDIAYANITAQENLLEDILRQSEVPMSLIASRLDVPVSEVDAIFAGKRDLTMTEIRLFAIAAGVVVSYVVRG